MGESAAAAMVDGLLQSSAFTKEHLFHRVVISSGAAVNPIFGLASKEWIVENSKSLFKEYFKNELYNDNKLVNAMRSFPAQHIQQHFWLPGRYYPFRPFRDDNKLFPGVDEFQFVDQRAFGKERMSEVPILLGWTSLENAFFLSEGSGKLGGT